MTSTETAAVVFSMQRQQRLLAVSPLQITCFHLNCYRRCYQEADAALTSSPDEA